MNRLTPHHAAAAALAAAHRPAAGPEPVSAGDLVGRPDLTEEDVVAAIRERLAFDGRTGPDPAVVLEAARLGKRKALTFLRKLVLPPPRMRLEMPVQPILKAHFENRAANGAGHITDTHPR